MAFAWRAWFTVHEEKTTSWSSWRLWLLALHRRKTSYGGFWRQPSKEDSKDLCLSWSMSSWSAMHDKVESSVQFGFVESIMEKLMEGCRMKGEMTSV